MEDTIKIDSLAYGGKGVARVGGKVAFVPFSAPGDELRVETTKEKKSFIEAEVTEIVKPSDIRVKPECEYYGRCGGCHLEHIDYKAEVEWKEKIFVETLKRIGKVELKELLPAISSPKDYKYRYRARLHVRGIFWGFYEAKSKNIVDISHCPLMKEEINEIFMALRHGIGTKLRSLHTVEIGVGSGGEVAALLTTSNYERNFDFGELLATTKGLSGLRGWLAKPESKLGRALFDGGDSTLSYKVNDIDIRLPLGVFSQVNMGLNSALVDTALDFVGEADNILDLFSGAGNFTLPLSKVAKSVTGIDGDRAAIKCGVKNAERNDIKNVHFHCLDASDLTASAIRKSLESPNLDVVVLDPPRGGGVDISGLVIELDPKKIVYISCDPPVMARDIARFKEAGYEPTRGRVIDLFPRTYHFEAVVELKKV